MASKRQEPIPPETTQPPIPTPNVYTGPGATTTTTTMPKPSSSQPQPSSPPTTMPVTTTTTTPVVRPNIAPSLQDDNIYTDLAEGQTYKTAIGVPGRKIFDSNGKLVKYQGYTYFTGPRYSTTSGAGAATGNKMVPAGKWVEPKYFAGDENEVFGMAIEDLSSLQRAMNQVGLLGDNYAPGTADNATRAAFTNLLEVANGYGEDYNAAIIRLASTGAGRRGSIAQYRVSNENDVKSVIGQVAKQLLGRNLGEGDLNRLAQMYRNLEQEAGMASAGDQQQVVAAPSVETFATSKLGNMFPTETNARKFGSYIEAIKEKYGI